MKFLILFIGLNSYASISTIEKLKQINIDYLSSQMDTINTKELKTKSLYQYFPTINLFANSFESDNSNNSFGTSTIQSEGISAQWTIFNFFQDTYLYHNQSHNFMSKKAFEQAMKLAAEKSSFDVYLNYLSSLEQFHVKKEIVETLYQSAKVANEKFSRGESSGSESSKIRIQALNTNNDAQTFKADSIFYEEKIKMLLKVNKLEKDWPISEDIFKTKIPLILAKKITTDKNPTISMLGFDKKAAADEIRANRSRNFGNVNLNYQNRKFNLDNYKEWDTQITLTYTLPLFANNSINADLVKAKSNYRIASEKLSQEKAKINALKKSLKIKLEISYDNYKRRFEASQLSNKIYNQELKKFKRGLISVNDLLFEQQRQSQSQLGLINSRKELTLTFLDYCHLQGIEFKDCI